MSQPGESVTDPAQDMETQPPCYTGALMKRQMMAARRLQGTMGVLGSMFPGCQLFGGFQTIFRCESPVQ
eukprot:8686178-Karenia_brevis.AAC.1